MTSNLASRTVLIIIGVLIVGGAGYIIGSQLNQNESKPRTYFFNFTEAGQQEAIKLEGDPPFIILIHVAYRVPREFGSGIPVVLLNATGVRSGVGSHPGLLFPGPDALYNPRFGQGNKNVQESTIITSLSEFTIQLSENPPAEVTLYVK